MSGYMSQQAAAQQTAPQSLFLEAATRWSRAKENLERIKGELSNVMAASEAAFQEEAQAWADLESASGRDRCLGEKAPYPPPPNVAGLVRR